MTLFVICAPNVWNSRSRSSLVHRRFLKVCVAWMSLVLCKLGIGSKLSEAVVGRCFLEVTGASRCFRGELSVTGALQLDDVAACSSSSSSSDSATDGRSGIAEHNLSTQY